MIDNSPTEKDHVLMVMSQWSEKRQRMCMFSANAKSVRNTPSWNLTVVADYQPTELLETDDLFGTIDDMYGIWLGVLNVD